MKSILQDERPFFENTQFCNPKSKVAYHHLKYVNTNNGLMKKIHHNLMGAYERFNRFNIL